MASWVRAWGSGETLGRPAVLRPPIGAGGRDEVNTLPVGGEGTGRPRGGGGGGAAQSEGSFTMVNQKSSMDFTTFTNWSRSTGLVM
jgi:hypothetical protein